GGLEEDHRLADRACRGHDDRRECRRDEERVAQPPAGPEADDGPDAVRGAGERGEDDNQREAGEQGALGAHAGGDDTGDEHGHAHDRHVAGEEQRGLARTGAELVGDGLEDRVHEADAHEGDDAGEGDRPDGTRLAPGGSGGFDGGAHAGEWGPSLVASRTSRSTRTAVARSSAVRFWWSVTTVATASALR